MKECRYAADLLSGENTIPHDITSPVGTENVSDSCFKPCRRSCISAFSLGFRIQLGLWLSKSQMPSQRSRVLSVRESRILANNLLLITTVSNALLERSSGLVGVLPPHPRRLPDRL